MKFKKFKKDDIYNNTIVTYPEYEFFVYDEKVYINRESEKDGDFSNKVNHVPQGFISLHEINVNRPSGQLVYPFITKDGARTAFRTVTTSNFQDSSQFQFGDTINGTYPLSSSINRIYIDSAQNDNKKFLSALKNPIEMGGYLGTHFNYAAFDAKDVNIIEIPSIFYGSSLKKGSVQLDYYITGTLTGRLQDTKKNGELIQTYGVNGNSGSVAGVVMYEYGICILTGSWDLNTNNDSKDRYFDGSTTSLPKWLNFGTGIQETVGTGSATSNHAVQTVPSYLVKVKGTNKIPTLTMLATANKSEFNYSSNPTFIDYNHQMTSSINSSSYSEDSAKIVNITKSKYAGYEEKFENTTYISKIGLYDKNKNLIGIASLANPVRKTELQEYLFKLRLDF
tara:strand:- start:736 stop:1917 length:1182 start_codon:yes stop_codon:yes gene_type:complete